MLKYLDLSIIREARRVQAEWEGVTGAQEHFRDVGTTESEGVAASEATEALQGDVEEDPGSQINKYL